MGFSIWKSVARVLEGVGGRKSTEVGSHCGTRHFGNWRARTATHIPGKTQNRRQNEEFAVWRLLCTVLALDVRPDIDEAQMRRIGKGCLSTMWICRKRIIGAWLLVTLSACGEPPSGRAPVAKAEPRRVANEVRASDFGDKWPFKIDRGVLACQASAATIRTFDNKEYALNGVAMSRKTFLPLEAIWKTQSAEEPKEILSRLDETARKRIFASTVRCEDEADRQAEQEIADVIKQIDRAKALSNRCKADLRSKETLTEAEIALISTEGVLKSWPPLHPTRVSVSPILEAALKLCK